MRDPDAGGDGSQRNDELDAVHRELVALVSKLDLAIDDAASATEVKALTGQIAAVNLRVAAVGRQLFARRTAEVTTAAAAVRAAIPEVENAVADLVDVDAFVASVTGVLELVDHAVETARMVP